MKQAVGRETESPFGLATNFFGAAATAGKILGLDSEKMTYALGIAFHQICGAQPGLGTGGSRPPVSRDQQWFCRQSRV